MQSIAALNDYVVKQWSTLDGLSSQSLNSVVQDQQGYMWIGTQFGLSRFDGKNFTNFNTSNSDFLTSNSINHLLVDNEGMLWIGTKKSLIRLDPKLLTFTRFNVKGAVRDILQDEDNRIWISANGLYLFYNNELSSINQLLNTRNLNIQNQGLYSSPRSQQKVISQLIGSVNKMAVSPEGIWLVTNRYLLRLTNLSADPGSTLRLELTAKISLPNRLAQSVIYDLAWLEGELYLASEQGAYFLDKGAYFSDIEEDDALRPFELPNGNNAAVFKFMSDADGALWVSTYGRLLYKDISSTEWQWIDQRNLDQSIWFSDIYRDKQNNIWLASKSEGLWKVNTGNIKRHTTFENKLEGIMAVTIAPNGILWAATRTGVGYFDEDNRFINKISVSSMNRAAVHDMFFQGEKLYLATEKGVLYFENEKVHTVAGAALRFNAVFSMVPASRGGLWLGTKRGLYRLAYNGLKPFVYNAFLDSKFVTYVLDKGAYGWVGTSKGAYYFTDRGIERIGMSTALNGAYVTSLLEIDAIGTFIGTLNEGLFFKGKDKQWHQFDISNGLPYGPIFSLHFDKKQQRLWVSTLKGLYRMPITQFDNDSGSLQVEQVITSLDKQLNGKASQCCAGLGNDAVVEKGNSLWYPSLQGLVEVPKEINLFGSNELLPHIESLNSDVRNIPYSGQGQLELDVDERNIAIKYTAIDFYAPAGIEFRYKLSGLDSGWRYAKNRREAIYTNLPPGSFNFDLEVKRHGDVWENAKSTEFSFLLPKRFDETIYFRLLITITFIVLLYLIFLVYRNQVNRTQLALAKQVEARTQELKASNDKLNEVNSQLKQVSHNDELTGLRSRRFLFDQLPKDIEHYQRNRDSLEKQGKALALVIINLDNFSSINDAHDPMSGDSCLRQMAALLNSKTQGSDYIVRWSGDEFLLLLRDMKKDSILNYIEGLSRAISNHAFKLPSGRNIRITSSIGWAFYPLPLLGGQIIGWETSINLADLALHKVKEQGKNGFANYSFDEQLDAFEFEESENIENQIDSFILNDLAKLDIWLQGKKSIA